MSFNISKENAIFITHRENNKTICIIDKTRYMFIDFMEDNLPIFNLDRKFEKELEMPDRFIGIATCSKDDEWNEDVGRAIAFSRAKDKLNRSFFKRANTYIKTLDDRIDQSVTTINAYGDKVAFNTGRRHNYIDKLLEKE